uniref:NADH:ubiquinone reductase (H(+)-translocating) n=1 Tax=Trouessartia rubecula TaxID=474308 RepID=A0A410HYG4_9ACAR|nr:NADH dehydrogenase subunit 5 [Trouessartia rubecula]QAB47274.1 NADH dehydrogenase subunit 5 [Trouessartia rubecula]
MGVYFFFWFFLLLGSFFIFLSVYFLTFNSLIIEIFLPCYFFGDFSLSFCADYVSMFFFSAVSLISSMVFVYSKYYMSMGKYNSMLDKRFLIILFLFVASMLFLVFSYSWFSVMLGWDGLGLISFLLVIYYNDPKSLESGLVTVFTNRIGDCLFLLSFSFMFFCGWFSFDYVSSHYFFWFFVFVTLGCMTKSAQMPFSSWLPAAMAAPTPVSSLVHSSTLVTAGVFLLIRFNYLLESVFFFLMVFSLLTMMLAGIFAVYELDFKKVVAMSTLSQLGFMIFSISLGNWLLGFLHVIFHAFFKSCLFLSTGNLMHFILGNQDSRLFGNFFMSFFSKLFFCMSCLSLMGFPFSLGFYSKDLILGSSMFFSGSLLVFCFCLSCCFTVSYSLRLLNLGFLKFSFFDSSFSFYESLIFFIPVSFLFFFNIFLGDFFMYFMIPIECFSFFEFFMGVFIIAGGFLLNYVLSKNYNFVFFFSTMLFLPSLVSSISLNGYNIVFFKDDITWNELLGAKGMDMLIISLKSLFNFFFSLKTFFLGIMLFMTVIFLFY